MLWGDSLESVVREDILKEGIQRVRIKDKHPVPPVCEGNAGTEFLDNKLIT